MVKRSYKDLIGIFGKWLGLYLEIYSKSRDYVWNFMDCRIILDKDRGLFVIVAGLFWFLNLFSNGKCGGLGSMAHGPRHTAGPSGTEDRGSGSSPEIALTVTLVRETSL
jgi:hypothetical protein